MRGFFGKENKSSEIEYSISTRYANKKTFTLIELLIVVVIIGILATVLISRIQGAQARTRDTIRLKDMCTLKTTLALYYADNQTYPSSTTCPPATIPNGSRCNSVENLSGGYRINNGALRPYISGDPTIEHRSMVFKGMMSLFLF